MATSVENRRPHPSTLLPYIGLIVSCSPSFAIPKLWECFEFETPHPISIKIFIIHLVPALYFKVMF
jgi:hypothetical protein